MSDDADQDGMVEVERYWRVQASSPLGALVVAALDVGHHDAALAARLLAGLCLLASRVDPQADDGWQRDATGGTLTASWGCVGALGDATLWPGMLRRLAEALASGDAVPAPPGPNSSGSDDIYVIFPAYVTGRGGEA